MVGYAEFRSFEDFKYLNKEDLEVVINYICLQMNNPGIGYKYFYDMYSYATKCRIVLQKKNSM